MKSTDQLSEFVREALAAGHEPDQIASGLIDAGWLPVEAHRAISDWTVIADLPPVPRPRPYLSAREVILYGLLFMSLLLVCWHICQLGFELVDFTFAQPEVYRSTASVRWAMASLIVFGPAFLLLNRQANRVTIAPVPRASVMRKRFAAVTLLLALIVLLGTLVSAIYTLLQGAFTLPFFLKALLVGIVAGLVLTYYRDEIDG